MTGSTNGPKGLRPIGLAPGTSLAEGLGLHRLGRQLPRETTATRPPAFRDSAATAHLVDGGPRPELRGPAGNTHDDAGRGTIRLPDGVTEAQVRTIFQKRMSGGELSAEERAVMTKMRQAMGGGHRPRGGAAQGSASGLTGGQYIVFVLRDGQPTAVPIRTGMTDLDYSEVIDGLSASDSVLVQPSASLVQSQQEFQERVNRMTGGGGVPGMRSQPAGDGGR